MRFRSTRPLTNRGTAEAKGQNYSFLSTQLQPWHDRSTWTSTGIERHPPHTCQAEHIWRLRGQSSLPRGALTLWRQKKAPETIHSDVFSHSLPSAYTRVLGFPGWVTLEQDRMGNSAVLARTWSDDVNPSKLCVCNSHLLWSAVWYMMNFFNTKKSILILESPNGLVALVVHQKMHF